MEVFATETLATTLALIGSVIVVAALVSGTIERTGTPQVAAFLLLGLLLGPYALDLTRFGIASPELRIVATLALLLVLFIDAVALKPADVRRHARLAFIALGPGTLLPALAIAGLGVWLLKLPVPHAFVLGAALASTDPVVMRGLLRRGDVPAAARSVLRLEGSMNDAVLLPIVLMAMLFMAADASPQAGDIFESLLAILVVGPAAGAGIGIAGIALLIRIRDRYGVRRDYESLYAIGIAFVSFAAAEALQGSGFLAAFAAGLTVAAADAELCDCFFDYGEATAEMALLFTFVAFGGTLVWRGLGVIEPATILFVVLALAVRPVVMAVALLGSGVEQRARWLIAWFGARGLSTLLIALLPVFAMLPGAERIFDVAALVVLASIVLHGGSILFVRSDRTGGRAPAGPRLPVIRPGAPIVAAADIVARLDAGEPLPLLDVRKASDVVLSGRAASRAVRPEGDNVAAWARSVDIPADALIAAFCACIDDGSSLRVARELRAAGWTNAVAVHGGWNALVAAGEPTVPLPASIAE